MKTKSTSAASRATASLLFISCLSRLAGVGEASHDIGILPKPQSTQAYDEFSIMRGGASGLFLEF